MAVRSNEIFLVALFEIVLCSCTNVTGIRLFDSRTEGKATTSGVSNLRTDQHGLIHLRWKRNINTPPVVTSPPAMKLTGKGTFEVTLFAQDNEGDNIEFALDEYKPKPLYGNVTLTRKGELTYITRSNDSAEDKIYFIVKEIYSNTGAGLLTTHSLLVMHLTDRDAKASITPMGKPVLPTTAPSRLKMWEIVAIIAGAALCVTLFSVCLTCCCCTFDPGNSRLPKVSPFGNHNAPRERRPSLMNPHYKPPRSSLLKRESIRCGAADGTPYYGVRRKNTWTPRPDDVPFRRDSFVMTPTPSIQSELYLASASRRPSIPTIPESPRNSVPTIAEESRDSPSNMVPRKFDSEVKVPSRRRSSCLSENMSVFGQVPWSAISSPSSH